MTQALYAHMNNKTMKKSGKHYVLMIFHQCSLAGPQA
jgi:hypothetical protein